MPERLIFLYHILCYSVGIMGLLASLFAAASGMGGKGSRSDLRFAFFTSAFALMVIPATVFAYLDSAHIALTVQAFIVSILSMIGESAFIFTLPFFLGSFLAPPRKAGGMTLWLLLSGFSVALIPVAFFIARLPSLSFLFYLPVIGMIAAIVDTFSTGKRAIAGLTAASAGTGDGTDADQTDSEAWARDDALRWLRVLKRFRLMAAIFFLPMAVIDFFPVLESRLYGFPPLFKLYPALYAGLNAVYAFESLALALRRGRRTGLDASLGAGDGRVRRYLSEAAERDGLSPREEEVALLLASGATYKEICWKLKIKMGTAQSHVISVYHKLGVNCKEDLMRLARGERETPIRKLSPP